jgi:prevent-host-death family protein
MFVLARAMRAIAIEALLKRDKMTTMTNMFILLEAIAMGVATWTVAEAKAKFSELVDKARVSGPQTITKNGHTTVVVVSAEEWERKTRRPGNLAEFFAESPLRGVELKVSRRKDGPREIDL